MRTTESKSEGDSRASSLPTLLGSPERLSPDIQRPDLPGTAQRAFNIIEGTKQGIRSDNPWIKIPLSPSDLALLNKRLQEEDLFEFTQNKIRLSTKPKVNFKTLTGTPLTDIEYLGSADIELYDPSGHYQYPRHSPDASFRFMGSRYPCIIIETSFSQKRRDLELLAENYILGSSGNIRVVIGLNIEYSGSKAAAVSVWVSDRGKEDDGTPYLQAKKTINNELFRNSDGSAISPSARVLHLPFSTLLPSGPEPLSKKALCIPYTTLFSFLVEAEKSHMDVKQGRGSVERLPPGTMLRKAGEVTRGAAYTGGWGKI
ncbi:MAG: hypothetical protein M1840_002167 [Geoglossum simile]|nr:MAG: hypothetical protein M1840_002167 [Geoglossum simile]